MDGLKCMWAASSWLRPSVVFVLIQTLSPPRVAWVQVHVNTGQLQYIRLAQPVSGAQVVQGQIQTLANTQQVTTSAREK